MRVRNWFISCLCLISAAIAIAAITDDEKEILNKWAGKAANKVQLGTLIDNAEDDSTFTSDVTVTEATPTLQLIDSTNSTDAIVATDDNGDLVLQADENAEAAGSDILLDVDGTTIATVDENGILLSTGTVTFTTSELTIATGAVTATAGIHTVDTESDASSDDLDTISGGTAGDILILSSADSARDVTLTENGNIKHSGTCVLSHANDVAILVYVGTSWLAIVCADNDT